MNLKICVIGLGYVGLPLAQEFSKKYQTIGYDINRERINQLKNNIDLTGEVSSEDLKKNNLKVSCAEEDLNDYNVYIITVPTPIDKAKKPDLRALKAASKLVGKFMSKGNIVVYESTVYPGCTLQDCVPIIEKESNLKLNKDFYCGYSPERINPGDKINTLCKIQKITSGSNDKALKIIDDLYKTIISAGTFPVDSIDIAEAAKVIENTQRDLNIAFINELALIFEKMNIDTTKVIEAASTKWNFMPFKPGLVGGHCIGVDPYYLTYKSELSGFSPEVILAGRKLNDSMGTYIAQRTLKLMVSNDIIIEKSKVLILGLSFKENCPDIRNTKVVDIINEFKSYNVSIDVYDPWVDKNEVFEEYGIIVHNKIPKKKYHGIVLAVAHNQFKNMNFDDFITEKTIIFDIKSFLTNLKDRKAYRL